MVQTLSSAKENNRDCWDRFGQSKGLIFYGQAGGWFFLYNVADHLLFGAFGAQGKNDNEVVFIAQVGKKECVISC
ncbi:hypothetical protein ACHQM5_023411 [Ranunculus cassubicifolius]